MRTKKTGARRGPVPGQKALAKTIIGDLGAQIARLEAKMNAIADSIGKIEAVVVGAVSEPAQATTPTEPPANLVVESPGE